MKNKLPRFASDKEVEEFLANADLTKYDLSEIRPTRFVFLLNARDVATNPGSRRRVAPRDDE